MGFEPTRAAWKPLCYHYTTSPWWGEKGSILRPADFQSTALPLIYRPKTEHIAFVRVKKNAIGILFIGGMPAPCPAAYID